eukprot:TRINITY_DN15859_c0_g1_i1.p1 TRINITY_DN15859_c0_g1~~TRINITY_DN15859_c0_g1_i1.p1  ORF type:complete len:422 (+),score=69.70 TRINITY_DN15859_c0_g1_i1:129-1268(+)
MDARKFVKCLGDSLLIDENFRAVDADLVFRKCKARGARKMDYSGFMRALGEVAKKQGMTQHQAEHIVCQAFATCKSRDAWKNHYYKFERALREVSEQEAITREHVEDIMCLAFAPDSEAASRDRNSVDVSGPARFYYDTSLYTGTHKHGGPSLVSSGCKTPPVDIKVLVNRDRESSLRTPAERRRKSPQLSVAASEEAEPMPVQLGRARTGSLQDRLEAARPNSATPLRGPGRGPERFYYDKSTYTGTHKNGGPTVTGNGLTKGGGYADLSELVCRDLIQDDDLHRRSRRRRALAKAEESVSSSDSPADCVQQPSISEAPLPVLLGAQTPAAAFIKIGGGKIPEDLPPAPEPILLKSPPFKVAASTIQWASGKDGLLSS